MNMKKYYVIISFVFLAYNLQAQGVFSIQSLPVCWSIGAVDSSLVANWLISANSPTPTVLGYLNAEGQAVSVAGGSVANGYCCCSGSGGGSTVTVTDNTDGTYTIIVDTDTTIIDTRSNSNPITQTITIGGLTYNAGDFVENVLIGISNYINADVAGEICGDTLVQVSHGFSIGDLIGQGPGNGAYFAANTANPDSFPVAAVRKVLSVDTFIVCNEGFFSGFAHGKPLGRDYFLQDDGSVDTIPDADYNVFAFRTFKATKAYFDIPELIVSDTSATGGGGSSYNVTASNGLNDANAGADVDVELGGTLDKNTDIELSTNIFTMTRTGAGIKFQVHGASATDGLRLSPNPATDLNRPLGAFLYKNTAAGNPASVQWADYDLPIQAPLFNNAHAHYVYDPFNGSYWVSGYPDGSGLYVQDSAQYYFRYYLGGPLLQDTEISLNEGTYDFEIFDGFPTVGLVDSVFKFRLAYDTAPYFQFEFDKDVGGGTILRSDIRVNDTEMYLRYSLGANGTVFRITPYSVVIESPPEYANDGAADADSNLPSGGVYTLTGDRTLYIKP